MRRRAALAAIVAAGSLAVAAAVVAPYVIADRGWAALQARVGQAIGARLSADGPLQGRLFPEPRLIIAGLEATAPGDPDGPPLIYADQARVDLGWEALLTGRLDSAMVQLRSVRVLALPLHPPADIEGRFDRGAARFEAEFEGGGGRLTLRPEVGGVRLDELQLTAGPLAVSGSGRAWLGDGTRMLLSLDDVRWGDTALGRIDVAATGERDGILVERAALRTADGAEVALYGLATVGAGEFRFSGGMDAQRESQTGNLRAGARVTGALGREVQRIDIDDFDLRVGPSHVTGSARYDSSATPQIGIDLRADRLALEGIGPSLAWSLAPWAAVSSGDLRLRAGEVTWDELSAQGVVLALEQRDRDFELKELAARDLAGATLHASGRFVRGRDGSFTFHALDFRYGQLAGKGRLAVDLAASPVRIAADVQTGPLMLDDIVGRPPPPPPEPMTRRAVEAALRQARTSRRQWSAEPLPWPRWPDVDAELHLAAPSIGWRGLRLDVASLTGRLEAGVLTLENLSGLIYGGRVEISGRQPAPGAASHSFAGTLRLRDLDLATVLQTYAGVSEIAGRLDGVLDVSGVGRSPTELIAGLGGKASFNAYDGVVDGFDLPRMSAGLAAIRRPTDLFQVLRTGLGSGRTPFRTLSGLFEIEKGVARTDDLKFVAAAGEGRTRGSIDLGAWTLDLVNEFRLTEHPDLPAVTLKLSGAVDAPRRVFDFERLQSSLARRGRKPSVR